MGVTPDFATLSMDVKKRMFERSEHASRRLIRGIDIIDKAYQPEPKNNVPTYLPSSLTSPIEVSPMARRALRRNEDGRLVKRCGGLIGRWSTSKPRSSEANTHRAG